MLRRDLRPKKTERTISPTFVLLAAARHLFRGSLGLAEVNVGEDIGPGLLSLEIGVMQDFFSIEDFRKKISDIQNRHKN